MESWQGLHGNTDTENEKLKLMLFRLFENNSSSIFQQNLSRRCYCKVIENLLAKIEMMIVQLIYKCHLQNSNKKITPRKG
jgi:hypothetical protein